MSICVIGASNVDILAYADYQLSSTEQDSHIGSIKISFGGVARNVSENLARLSLPNQLLSVVAKDSLGTLLIDYMKSLGSVDCSHVLLLDRERTSTYNAFHNEKGEMHYAVSDMHITEHLNPTYFEKKKNIILSSDVAVLDANLTQESIEYVLALRGPQYIVETVSGSKAHKVRSSLDKIHLLKTNAVELAAVIKDMNKNYYQDLLHFTEEDNVSEFTKDALSKDDPLFLLLFNIGSLLLSKGLSILVVSLGKKGLFYIAQSNSGTECKQLYLDSDKLSSISIKSSTGAGDALCAGIVYAMYHRHSLFDALSYGIAVATHTLQGTEAVSQNMDKEVLQEYISYIRSYEL